MATYKVQPNQNIFDISLQLYGTIEGAFDLLITNTWLDMDMDLATGQELEYHEDFVLNSTIVENLSNDGIIPSNGERHVYYKRPDEELLAICNVSSDAYTSELTIGGEGTLIVDWGDNSALESIVLSHVNRTVVHYFDSTMEQRRIKMYGDTSTLKFTYLDTTKLEGALTMTCPVTVDEYVSRSNGHSLTGLFLFDGTYKVDLKLCTISNLLPIGDMDLQELDLSQVRFTSIDVLDEYLAYVVANYGTRRGCIVNLTTEPSSIGMAAINTIIGEEEWNTPTPWKFVINDKIYTYSA